MRDAPEYDAPKRMHYSEVSLTCHDSLNGGLKMFQLHVGGKISRCDERSLVADIGDVGSSEPRGSGRHLTGQLLSVLTCLDRRQVNLEYGRSNRDYENNVRFFVRASTVYNACPLV